MTPQPQPHCPYVADTFCPGECQYLLREGECINQLGELAVIAMSCPACGARHVDEGEWAKRPHHKHLCASCGHIWRVEPHVFGAAALPSFVCPLCRRRSYHPMDIKEHFCGDCGFVDDVIEAILRYAPP
jgi:hypothetical protein